MAENTQGIQAMNLFLSPSTPLWMTEKALSSNASHKEFKIKTLHSLCGLLLCALCG